MSQQLTPESVNDLLKALKGLITTSREVIFSFVNPDGKPQRDLTVPSSIVYAAWYRDPGRRIEINLGWAVTFQVHVRGFVPQAEPDAVVNWRIEGRTAYFVLKCIEGEFTRTFHFVKA